MFPHLEPTLSNLKPSGGLQPAWKGGLARNGNELDAKRGLDASGKVGQDISHTDRLVGPICKIVESNKA